MVNTSWHLTFAADRNDALASSSALRFRYHRGSVLPRRTGSTSNTSQMRTMTLTQAEYSRDVMEVTVGGFAN
ncbi:hypothetical protein BV22DRAFT_1042354 [Leucogyrophana mollusca]|uniref:Uncharacterized protein n=1 Tax=Leucogyrophana mollusca TaxID=85980 RepID=A0ACB8AV61_9AGAM|nr:hypothetical protein BV22DRAFT_1042354 [Leucogyrophana mollusca]